MTFARLIASTAASLTLAGAVAAQDTSIIVQSTTSTANSGLYDYLLPIYTGESGITVNVVAPAATDTPQLRDPARADAPVRPLPFGRVIRPEEVAATVAFLTSVDAGAITGQTITQCGGASLVASQSERSPT